MKTIGLLGGTGWSSTIDYYRLINQRVNQSLGGAHSAKILLKSIDYDEIMRGYGVLDDAKMASLLKKEVLELLALKPDLFLICCNTLHKYYDMIQKEINTPIPIMHIVEITRDALKEKGHKKVLFLATRFTMEDPFFKGTLEKAGIEVIIPDQEERDRIHIIHREELMKDLVKEESQLFFKELLQKYQDVDAVILACTELGLIIHQEMSKKPLLNTLVLQCEKAVERALFK